MTAEQKEEIKRKTGYEYNDIMLMSDKEFWTSITRLVATGEITYKQWEWLNKQRKTHDLDPITQEALNIFGGEIIK